MSFGVEWLYNTTSSYRKGEKGMDTVIKTLNINQSAVELISMIKFLFATQEEIQELLLDCMGLEGKDINKYVYAKRKKNIEMLQYASRIEFEDSYKGNKQTALERMFQEPLNEAKLSKLKINDPLQIWEIHRTKDPAIRFMHFCLYS